MVVGSVVSRKRNDRVGQWILSPKMICAGCAGGAGRDAASFDASGGARLRQEFAQRVLCKRQLSFISANRFGSTFTLFRSTRVPIGIREMRFAEPLAAVLAILQAFLVAGLIHSRNRLTKLFLGLCCCRFHRIFRVSGGVLGEEALSGRGPPLPPCPRRCRQYTPVRRQLPPYYAQRLLLRGWALWRNFPS